jgi:glycosyltransferase involved in cell wall biosynthesis
MSRAAPHLAVDARMIAASGIGTYLANLLAELVPAHPGTAFSIYGDPAALATFSWAAAANVTVRPWTSPVLSLRGLMGAPLVGAAPDAMWFPHYVLPVRVPVPVLVTVHDVFHIAHPELMGGLHRRLTARWLFSRARRRAGGLVFVSQFTASEFTRLVGAPRCPAGVIANGVGTAWSQADAGPSPHPRPYLVAVGNVKPHKNLTRLLAAMELLPEGASDLDLVLVGQRDGFLNGDPRVAALATRLGARVHFTGRISDAQVRRHVAHARALVFPSLYEGFGLPPLEAMAAGTAVVASRIPAVAEVCADAVRYVDPLDPRDIAAGIAAVAGDPVERARLVALGRARAQGYSWARAAAQTWAALAAVAGWSDAPAAAAARPAGGVVGA